MPLIRDFQKHDEILVFDSHLDESFSTYDAQHLEALAQEEEKHFWFLRRRDKICDAFLSNVPKSAKVLEIGGGTGFIAAKLIELGFSIEMADIHSYGLRLAKNRGITKLYQFDLFRPPFHQEFDVICLFDVLEHLHHPLKALQSLKSMLKPGGMVILTVPAHQWLWNRDDVLAGHQKRYTRHSLKQVFHGSGFKPVAVRYFFSAIIPFLLLRRWVKRDDGSPLRKEEVFKIKTQPFVNCVLDIATRLEFSLDRLLPNIAGGSLLAIATADIPCDH